MATTVQEIINWVDRKYFNKETDANKIIDLNVHYKNLFNRMQQLTDSFEIAESYTIADQATYNLPTKAKIYTIKKILVSRVTYDEIDSGTEWDEYKYAGLSDIIDYGTYYGRVFDDL